MRACYRAAAHIQRRTDELFDRQGFGPHRCAHDVHDRICCTDLMKMNVFSADVVDLGLGRAQRTKDVARRSLGAAADACSIDEVQNLAQSPAVPVLP